MRPRSRDIRRARLDKARHQFDHLTPEPGEDDADASQFDLEDWLDSKGPWAEPMPHEDGRHGFY